MRKYGFNMQWSFSYDGKPAAPPDEKELDFIAKKGLDYIRVPMDYRFWTKDFDYKHPDESAFEVFDTYLKACRERRLHMTLNLHRAPGYCINNNSIERHNLWKDKVAQDAFVFIWEYFTARYKGVSPDDLSFDLLNEPPEAGQYGFTRKRHERIMRRTIDSILDIDPNRLLIINGVGGGGLAIPELADIGVIHSARGYAPYTVSHYLAQWMQVPEGYAWKTPEYPGLSDGDMWDRATLEKYYEPWREVEQMGTDVYIGEFGCYNKTPNDVAMRWLRDLLGLFREYKWGFALWNFKGDFGIVEHGRPGAKYEMMDGFKVDRELLELLIESKV